MRRFTRREFLTISARGLVVMASGLASCAPPSTPAPAPVSPTRPELYPTDASQPLPVPLWITRTADFYTVKYGDMPDVSLDSWRLFVYGKVREPLKLSLDDVKALPASETMHTLECIGNPVGGNLIGNATWRGISLRDLLARAGADERAGFVTLGSVDEYFTTVPLATALHEHALLAYEMNDAPLTPAHGFPLRALLPGVYGQKQPKWLTSIEVSDEDKLGPWEQKGWSKRATIQINSGIKLPRDDAPLARGDLLIAGVALADANGVRAVQVSTDAGATWREATLTRPPSSFVWTPWGYQFKNPAPGKYTLMARAVDHAGKSQNDASASLLADAFPDGASAIHARTIQIL